MTKPDYQEYLKSERWATLREAKRADADFKCQLCNSQQDLRCHHKTYEHLCKPLEFLDLIVLCNCCHERYHEIESPIPREEWIDKIAGMDVSAGEFNHIMAAILTRRAENSQGDEPVVDMDVDTPGAHSKEDPITFEQFYEVYPKKMSKLKASEEWQILNPDTDLSWKMLIALNRYIQTKKWAIGGGMYIPYPGNWIQRRQWEDVIHNDDLISPLSYRDEGPTEEEFSDDNPF